ncbi:hypothetical protein PBCVNEJV1_725L [Paramecium bursaria Chlorella virus NE-JV-1]|nr:hypothetical protein PBCVNEJV1_725L [Paramecium bursaria Chlorella virus NE-JV-1]
MKTLHVIFVAVFAAFCTWMFMNFKEKFTTNFQPSANNLEMDIKGYAYQFGDRRADLDTYFGFPDNLSAVFSKRLLPDIIPQD